MNGGWQVTGTGIFADAYGRADFPLGGRHLIEASAGTGKTYSIQNVFARLLVDAAWRGEPLRVGEILVVTFTNAATQELKDRLRGVLEGLRAALDDLDAADEKKRRAAEEELARRLGTGPGQWEDRERRVRLARWEADDALKEFDTAAISTIHGFCERTRRRHAFETGAALDAELDETDARVVADLCAAWVRGHLDEARAAGLTAELLAGRYIGPLLQRHDVAFDERGGGDPGAETALARLRAAKDVLERMKAGLKTRKTLSFDDLLLVLRESLRDPATGEALRQALREDYKAVLIDEFQDTDPVQYGIFREAFFGDGDGVPVFFVGDPKQAIYAFRGGDIQTYERAKRELEEAGGASYRLGCNYRARPRLVEAVNRLFGDGAEGSVFGGGISYGGDVDSDPSKTGLFERGKEEETPFHAVVLTPGDGGGDIHAAVLREIAARAVGLLNDGGVSTDSEGKQRLKPGEIAVLVPSNDDARKVAELLARRGVPGVVVTDESVFASQEAADLRCVLEAVAGSGSTGRMRAALATPLFGFGIHDLILLMKGGRAKRPAGFRAGLAEGEEAGGADFETCRKYFAELRDLWAERGVSAVLRRVERDGGVRERVRRGGGERQLTNYQHLGECLHRAERDGHLPPEGLLTWFRRAVQDPSRAGDGIELRLESDENAVQIMTVHKSKGLEFPVVFVAAMDGRPLLPKWTAKGALNKHPASLDKFALGFFHDDGGRLTVYSREATLKDDCRNARAEAEIREEKMRQLYVALTRASKRCVAVMGWGENEGPDEGLKRLLANAGLSAEPGVRTSGPFRVESRRLDGVDAGAGPRWEGEVREAVCAEPPPAWTGEWTPRFGASYSMLCEGQEGATARDDDSAGADVDAGTGEGRSAEPSKLPIFTQFRAGEGVGTAFHELFEKISFQATGAERDAAVRRILARHGLLPADGDGARRALDAARGMLEATLELPLEGPGGGTFRLSDVPDGDRMAEWEFLYPLRRGIDMDAFRRVVEEHWRGDADKRPYLERLAGLKGRLDPSWMKGYVDLFFRRGGRYYVLDWKSNVLDGHEDSFGPARLREEMARHLYFVQYLLYAAVVHAWLKRTLPGYSWARNFGGVRYVFLRGACISGAGPERAVVADRPPEAMLDELGRLFGAAE